VELAGKFGEKALSKSRRNYDLGSGTLAGSKEANGKSSLTKKPSQINMQKNDSTSQ
jgi:hypothetical protein